MSRQWSLRWYSSSFSSRTQRVRQQVCRSSFARQWMAPLTSRLTIGCSAMMRSGGLTLTCASQVAPTAHLIASELDLCEKALRSTPWGAPCSTTASCEGHATSCTSTIRSASAMPLSTRDMRKNITIGYASCLSLGTCPILISVWLACRRRWKCTLRPPPCPRRVPS